MNEDLQCWYKALDLEPGASLEEVNQAHKDLALVWHPDRLPQDSPRLQEKAHAKLQEINNARDKLREYQANNSSVNNSTNGTGAAARSAHVPDRGSTYQSSPRQQPRRTSARSQETRTVRQPQAAKPSQPVRTTESRYPQSPATRLSNRQQQSRVPARTPPQRPDLSGVDWSGSCLNERDLSGRNLTNANLSNTDLQDSFLHGANLQGANLQKANLFRANLFQANLANANLRDANLIGADFSGADLSGADLTGARVRVGGKIAVRLIGAVLTGAIMPDGNVYG
ncbi:MULTISPECIES: pentapeptide repeat-containing protein [unclassified Chamaesiphon]|uniref:pentapeptide repeat-containing protein n=1 Tax=unclassified Chamaesiphon TaxID=2620921 RepID=UPI00286A6678|nr:MULTISPECIES: pentapeptide repeat-containing protein [unclassified Chamaesiphon]